MKNEYVLDACALIAFYTGEDGAHRVAEIIRKSARGQCQVVIHKVNLLEAYYGILSITNKEEADRILQDFAKFDVSIHDALPDPIFYEAARLKSMYRISLADSIALAEAKTRGAKMVTSDHHEMDEIERREKIGFYWIR